MNRLLLSAMLVAGALVAPPRTTAAEGQWMDVEGVSVPVPPAEHPRLFVRPYHVKELQRRTEHPVTKAAWQKLEAAAKQNPLIAVEVDAVRYLITRDEGLGRRTAAAGLRLLREEKIDRKGQDATRPIGRLMVAGAIAYDWCYPLLDADQKQGYLKELLRLAKDLEYGYPPPKRDAVTGHYSEWMVMRDLLAAGVALYDEFPEMYRIAAHRFFAHFLGVRNWWYPGHAFHQGTSYFETRFSSDLYPLFIFDRLGAGNVYHPSQQFVPYQSIYMRRPDGQMIRAGDGQGKIPKLRSLLVAAYYKDPYILADYLIEPGVDPGSAIFEFLWSDLNLKPRPLSELPLSRYMGMPYGWMVARTGWDANSVIAEMKVNIFNFGNHQHLDAGAFQIYYQGPLAMDSGIYEGANGAYGSPHDVNYHKRTIAHNSLLVYDPDEVFRWRNTDRVYANDGGQKFPNGWREPRSVEEMLAHYKTGEVLGQGFGPDPHAPSYTYLKGDLTAAYSDKVRDVRRSFVFLNLGGKVPAALVVFDKVVSANPQFKKFWLLHSVEEPQVERDSFAVSLSQRGWTGKLVNKVVMPQAAEIAKVGGPGKEFWVFGQNFPNHPRQAHAATAEMGEWRVEISPRQAAETDLFLNVLQPMDRGTSPLEVTRIESGGVVGVQVANRAVLFSRDSRLMDRPVAFSVKGAGTFGILATDLAEGPWQVWRDGAIVRPALQVSSSEGTLWFEGPAGQYELRR